MTSEKCDERDMWKHRSIGMRCSTCMWFVQKVNGDCAKIADPRGEFGRCHRHAPTMNGYPGVFETDWCGDHTADENKL